MIRCPWYMPPCLGPMKQHAYILSISTQVKYTTNSDGPFRSLNVTPIKWWHASQCLEQQWEGEQQIQLFLASFVSFGRSPSLFHFLNSQVSSMLLLWFPVQASKKFHSNKDQRSPSTGMAKVHWSHQTHSILKAVRPMDTSFSIRLWKLFHFGHTNFSWRK